VVPEGHHLSERTDVARIIVMSETSVDRGEVITLDERVAPAHMEDGHHSAQFVERVGWAVHDADEAASVGTTAGAAASNRDHQGVGDSDRITPRPGQVSRVQRTLRRRDAQTPD
jgi:hypothetical protein